MVGGARLYKLRQVRGRPTERPEWFDHHALLRVSLTTWNAYKHYVKTSLPFDIVTAASVLPRFKEGLCCDNPRPSTGGLVEPGKTDDKRWTCLSCGKRVKVRGAAGNSYLKTYGEVIGNSLVWSFQRKRLAASGAEPDELAEGLTIPRPVHIEKIRYCGKEVMVDTSEAPIEEGLTAEEMEATPTLEYIPLASQEAQRLLAEGVNVGDAARNSGVHRSTAWRIQNGQKPREKTARKLLRAGLEEELLDDDLLRGLVRKAGIEKVARLSGLNPRTVYRLLNGQKPREKTAMKMLGALARIYVECENWAA